MIRRILIVLFIFMGVSLVLLWFLTGGVGRVQRAAGSLSNPLAILFGDGTPGSFSFTLPWQPQDLSLGADISQYTDRSDSTADSYSPENVQTARESMQDTQQGIAEVQSQIDAVRQNINDVRSFGDPSPYSGDVRILDRSSFAGTSVDSEYITLAASDSNTAPVDVTGWSLQSVLTGKIMLFPKAATLFVAGAINAAGAVQLNPGSTAIVSTGESPTGVSFRENMCSGYLSQFQDFTPEIERSCPDPRDALPETPENLHRYSASCFSYVQTIPRCRFPAGGTPPGISPQCVSFARNTYTYDGCVQLYQSRTDFQKNVWRLFLNAPHPLWSASHDIIRLLDKQGRTVDILKY